MKRFLQATAGLLLMLGFIAGMTGCSTFDEDEHSQQVPWSRPASWEGTMPGMPATPGG